MAFNENSRVKIPALLHLMRLGYTYIPLREQIRRSDSNIFEDIFLESLQRINPDVALEEIIRKVKVGHDNGSNPATPTKKARQQVGLFLF